MQVPNKGKTIIPERIVRAFYAQLVSDLKKVRERLAHAA